MGMKNLEDNMMLIGLTTLAREQLAEINRTVKATKKYLTRELKDSGISIEQISDRIEDFIWGMDKNSDILKCIRNLEDNLQYDLKRDNER